jgi:hypothetical protein
MKKPRVEIPRAPIEFLLESNPQALRKTCKNHGEIFAIFDSDVARPSVQAIEIIRHVDASFDRKKSRWDYQSKP